MLTISTLKKKIQTFEKEDLIEVVLELAKYDKANLKFLDVLLSSSDNIDYNLLSIEAKQKIYKYIFGKSVTGKDSLKLRDARNVISDYAKLVKDNFQFIADLKLYYVEICNEFTTDYGDINEQFYYSIESMFNNLCKDIIKQPNLYVIFKERINKYFQNSRDFGWGYSDEILQIYYGLLDDLGIDTEEE